ncbi:hypothetical protein PHYPO_G00142860 [Pangasianodon hypophthalmus]|uniref:Uncharacterized protein n=1 Tax=Pangasianodon hypophthalmus TaxID=310915 RepID=A0A5N5KEB0_PANHP|nr:uncharacterized protein LOC117595907 [Pangasianodon hypophthalmus]XP_053084724.1 uncharacterized protein LOC117595907 [Pangasianodon hypophthalmus]KAB5528666.1 hypothetical protein PHYPO_G00142860 [Pangasianodon hypophthalmus]
MGPTPAPESKPARLEISGGKSAYIKPVRSIVSQARSHQIVVEHSQRKKTSNLTVYKVPNKRDKSVSMAFCFELRKKKYFPVVERDSENKMSLKIQAQNEPKKFSERFLFRWAENNGEYGSLCSVAEPSQYLCVCKNQVTISSNPDLGFRVQFLESSTKNLNAQSAQQWHRGGARRACKAFRAEEGPAVGGHQRRSKN